MPAQTVIAGTLAARRIELGKDQDDIAAECGVSQATVSRWEKGEMMPRTRNRRERASRAYGCDTVPEFYELFARTEAAYSYIKRPLCNIATYLRIMLFPPASTASASLPV